MKIVQAIIFLLFVISVEGKAQSAFFDSDALSHGKEVMIPRPATTLISLKSRVTLRSTDYPQTVRFLPKNINNGPVFNLSIAIYDRKQERVQYIDLKPGLPFLYSFKGLNSIVVIPELSDQTKKKIGKNSALYKALKLQVESDKPLSIQR